MRKKISDGLSNKELGALAKYHTLANELLRTLHMQHRRIKTEEPEDLSFLFRRPADWLFFIIVLDRIQKLFETICLIKPFDKILADGLDVFKKKFPNLRKMRNVLLHMDEYIIGSTKCCHKDVPRGKLQVLTYDKNNFEWLEIKIEAKTAIKISEYLVATFNKTLTEDTFS